MADKTLTPDQIDALSAAAHHANARAIPVWDADHRISEMALWSHGECIGNVALRGPSGRLEAFSTLGQRWWKARDIPHAVALALNGTQFRAFQKQKSGAEATDDLRTISTTKEPQDAVECG